MMNERQKIKVRMFFELMGWPPEALNKHLEQIVEHLKKSWKVTKEEYAEPEKIHKDVEVQEGSEPNKEETSKKNEMFSSHVEIEAEVSNLPDLFMVILNFGPSVTEIIEPEEVFITANELQDIMADISAKVNAMDMDVKILAAQLKQATDILQKIQKKPETEKEVQNKSPEEGSKFTI